MTTVDSRVRSVLAEPRGHRFSRPGVTHTGVNRKPESPEARRQWLLRQMEGNPRVAYMLQHGAVPHWVYVARQQREQAEQESRTARAAEGPLPAVPPTAPRGRHRAPRRWSGWPALAISATLLFGQTVVEAVGQEVGLSAGFLL